MSRTRTLAKAHSNVSCRTSHHDLEATIAYCLRSDDNPYGFRHRAAAVRHLLLDPEQTRLKRRYNRIARRVARRECRLAVAAL